jgi:hypothetical protein
MPRKANTATSPAGEQTPDFMHWVAEAAYFMAAERAFAPGMELDDWLRAEAQIRAALEASSRDVKPTAKAKAQARTKTKTKVPGSAEDAAPRRRKAAAKDS